LLQHRSERQCRSRRVVRRPRQRSGEADVHADRKQERQHYHHNHINYYNSVYDPNTHTTTIHLPSGHNIVDVNVINANGVDTNTVNANDVDANTLGP